MIEVTDEMRAAFDAAIRRPARIEMEDQELDACLAAVLAIVERDWNMQPNPNAMVDPTVKVKWVCRKCGCPLEPCFTCGEPSQCGDGFCGGCA